MPRMTIEPVNIPPIDLPVDIDPPAHEDSHATTDCGPLVGHPTHSRCPGWLSGVYGLVACDCWCHRRHRDPTHVFVQPLERPTPTDTSTCAICGDPDDGHDHVPTQRPPLAGVDIPSGAVPSPFTIAGAIILSETDPNFKPIVLKMNGEELTADD